MKRGALIVFFGADERSRTSDLLITNQLLYQLSYISEARHFSKNPNPYLSPPPQCLLGPPSVRAMATSGLLCMVVGHPLHLILRPQKYGHPFMQLGWLNIEDAHLAIGGCAARLLDQQ